jgi:hypothetical protein
LGDEALSGEPELEIKYYDSASQALRTVKAKNLEDQFPKIKRVLENVIKQMQTLGNYELVSFSASASITEDVWVLAATGEVSFTWEKKSKAT